MFSTVINCLARSMSHSSPCSPANHPAQVAQQYPHDWKPSNHPDAACIRAAVSRKFSHWHPPTILSILLGGAVCLLHLGGVNQRNFMFSRKFNWRKFSRRSLLVIVLIGTLLVAARLALPYAVQRYVNQVLNRIPGYRGQIGTVTISLWRGAYQIQDLRLQKLSGTVPMPFFEVKTVDLMLEWSELFHGALVGQITLYQPKLNYVAGPTAAQSQTTIDKSWQQSVTELFPLRINHFRIINGEVHFHNFYSEPPVDLVLNDIQADASNLQNSRRRGENLFATVDITGHPLTEASLRVHLLVDPLAPKPTFTMNGELLKVPLEQLNTYFMAYGDFEIKGGQLDLYTEMAASNGSVKGYVKPILLHTAVNVWSGHETKAAQYVIEPLVALLSLIMKNWSHDQFATTIPVSGNFDDPRLDSWTAFINLLKNAWVEALKPGLNGSVNLPAGQDAKPLPVENKPSAPLKLLPAGSH